MPLATAAALASGLPFLIVRSSAKAYGTARRIEGVYEPGERVLLVEDVVTAGGAALEAVRALRSEGLEVARALCVLDRAEGGAEALAEEGVELRSLLTRADVGWAARNRHSNAGWRRPIALLASARSRR